MKWPENELFVPDLAIFKQCLSNLKFWLDDQLLYILNIHKTILRSIRIIVTKIPAKTADRRF